MKTRNREKSTEKWWTGGMGPVDVGESLRIVPYWESWRPRSNRHEVIIDPGASFGAGDHPTTIIALELLEKTLNDKFITGRNISLLDVGTGTGVLSLAARAVGCNFVVACDLDPSAIYLVQRNIRLNSTIHPELKENGVNLYVGPVHAIGSVFDVVVANLAAPVLIRLKRNLIDCSGSYLILSGIPDSMFDLVRNEFSLVCVKLERTIRLKEWNGFIFRTS